MAKQRGLNNFKIKTMATEIKINENSITLDGVEYIKKEQTPKDGEVWYVEHELYKYLFIYRPDTPKTSCYFNINLVDVYSIGDKISYNNCQYYVLEIGENTEGNLHELIIGR